MYTFGGSSNPTTDFSFEDTFNTDNYQIMGTSVTRVVANQSWTLQNPIVARIPDSPFTNLPEPFIVYRYYGRNDRRVITLSPNETRARYGDLIKPEWTVVDNF